MKKKSNRESSKLGKDSEGGLSARKWSKKLSRESSELDEDGKNSPSKRR